MINFPFHPPPATDTFLIESVLAASFFNAVAFHERTTCHFGVVNKRCVAGYVCKCNTSKEPRAYRFFHVNRYFLLAPRVCPYRY